MAALVLALPQIEAVTVFVGLTCADRVGADAPQLQVAGHPLPPRWKQK
ncbi:MAG: hypothetical protein KGS46_10400 [Chloroflexi bacterium]|nr:hypothetical protein [Chloroflexota bacterium]